MRPHLLLLTAVLAAAQPSCSPTPAVAAPVVSGPIGFTGALAPGDSIGPYVFRLPSATPGATGYAWTLAVSKTNGTFPGAPFAQNTVGDSLLITVPTGGAWDSVTFTLTVKPTSTLRSAKAAASTTWTLYRYLASPSSFVVDSTRLGPISMTIRNDTVLTLANGMVTTTARTTVSSHGAATNTVLLTSSTVQLCAYVRFGSGLMTPVGDTLNCGRIGSMYFKASRLAQLPTPAESRWLSAACLTDWSSCLVGQVPSVVRDALLVHRA